MLGKNYNGTRFLNRFVEKEPVRTVEEENFIKNVGDIKSYKVSKEEIDLIISDMMKGKRVFKSI